MIGGADAGWPGADTRRVFGPILRGERVTLRPPTADDAKTFIEWFADTEVTRYLDRRTPLSLHEEEDALKRLSESKSDVFWVIETDGRTVGVIGIHAIDWVSARASTGIAIGDKSYWRRGIATESMALRTRFAFRELNLHKLWSSAFMENEGSKRALMKSGYRQVGIFREHMFREGRYRDMWVGEVLREEWERAQGAADVRER